MSDSNRFEHNIDLLKKKVGAEAINAISSLKEIQPQPWALCRTGPFNQLNLKRVSKGKEFYIHSAENCVAEAEQWLSEIDLASKEVLVVYGVGLGYYYQAAKKWLHARSNRKMIFIEDDLLVIYQFLQTDEATELLEDPQVDLHAIHVKYSTDDEIMKLVDGILFRQVDVSALREYLQRRGEVFKFIQFQFEFSKQGREIENVEYLDSGRAYFSNYFRNVTQMPSATFATGLKGYFKGIPAVICGAGPSLKKHLGSLKSLYDRALIFAGGSSMNVLNGNNLMPHFGIGLDPFGTQFTRLVTNTAYEVPFFYTNRVNHKALEMIHGSRLFVSNSGAYPIGPWLDQRLGIKSEWIDAGANVVNFSVSLAEFLGCNPIILIGVDLAYTEGDSYAPGIASHAIHNPKETVITKNPHEELVIRSDINGKPVHTLWKWITESYWFSMFAHNHPNSLLINSTEGGIGFQNIANVTLQEAMDKYLKAQFDIRGMVNTAIQQNPMPASATTENVRKAIADLRLSLLDILKVLEKYRADIALPAHFDEELQAHEAYSALIANLDDRLKDFTKLILASSDEPEKLSYEFPTRIHFLNETIQHLLRYMQLADAYLAAEQLTPKLGHQYHPPEISEKEHYSFDGKSFTIEDPDLGILIKGEVENELLNMDSPQPWNGKLLSYGPKKQLLMEQYYKEGLLHGPAIGYGSNEQEISKSWFVNGVRQGKAIFYYDNGQLYAEERYVDGEKEGYQVYLYPDGNLKSTIPFKRGKLDGLVRLFYPNGLPMREIFFTEGKRNGTDQLLRPTGVKWVEAEYVLEVPKGSAREWHENGRLMKEVIFGPDGERMKETFWDNLGKEIRQTPSLKEDYFERFSKQTQVLSDSIEGVLAKVTELSELFKGSNLDESEKKDFETLKEQLLKLKEANELMIALAKGTDEQNREMIWKSPLAREAIEKQSAILTDKLRLAFTRIQTHVGYLKKHFDHPQDKPKDDTQS